MIWPLLTLALKVESDIVMARQRARTVAEALGFDTQDQTRVATAVSEIARNAFGYGGGGKIEFGVEDGASQSLVAVVTDHGPGIAQLEDILAGTYSSATGMGLGMVGARRLMDRFEVESEPDRGTRVTLGKVLPPARLRLTGKAVGEIAACLPTAASGEAAAAIGEANRALIQSLEELRQRNEELAQLNAELENTNRGVVALYAELDDTAEKLRTASEAKSRFLSHISHEFRTPLNSINALAGLLLERVDGPLTTEQERQVGYIRSSAETLSELVNDLLDIAKVEAGKIDVKLSEFDLASLFAGLRGLMKPLQANSAAELIFDNVVGLPPLQSDEGKVAQILRNLISNALKFTEQGEVCVTARQEQADKVIVEVRDTGVGLAPEDQGRIFQEFEQVASALQAKVKGTGLGLPLSRRLAELLGGTLTVESEVGRGSTFRLELPIDIRPAAADPRRVLVVDDEEAFRYALRHMVGPEHEVFEAVDGVQALDAIREHRPAVVFLDLNMPSLDGYAVLSRIAEDSSHEGMTVVVSTSALLEDRDRARLGRADYVLSKDQLSRETVAALIAGVAP